MSGRVVVVGNSFVGAVISALEEDLALAGGYRFDFAGSKGGDFAGIRLKGGRFVNVRSSDRFQTGHIDDYDAAIVYGRFPSPHELIAQRDKLARAKYSSQVLAATLRDGMLGSEQMPVYHHLKEKMRAPVIMLSANVSTTLGAIGRADYDWGVGLIRELLGDDYLEAPAAMFTADLAPETGYYKGSVTIEGRGLGEERQSRHDVNHLNVAGGAIVARQMVAHLRALGIGAALTNDNEARRAAL